LSFATLNIDDFSRDVARTLVILASVFPRPREVFVEDVYQPEETDEFGMHSDRYLACFQTLVWMREEGFIRFTNTVRTDSVEQAVLTGRCLALLIQPTSLQGGSPAIAIETNTLLHQLHAALELGSSTAIRLSVMDLVSDMVRYPTMPPVVPGTAMEQAI
jgi:hypothetical protein